MDVPVNRWVPRNAVVTVAAVVAAVGLLSGCDMRGTSTADEGRGAGKASPDRAAFEPASSGQAPEPAEPAAAPLSLTTSTSSTATSPPDVTAPEQELAAPAPMQTLVVSADDEAPPPQRGDESGPSADEAARHGEEAPPQHEEQPGTQVETPTPRQEPPSYSLPTPLMVSALAGWLVAALLATLMLYLTSRWRTAFETKEWVLLPSDHATQLNAGFLQLCDRTVQSLESVVNACNANSRQAAAAAAATQETRGEFCILRDELDRKTREVADLRMGHEFHHRRPLLRRLIHVLQIIEEDTAASRNVVETLQGVLVELRECLDENSIATLENPPGTRIAEARALDVAGSAKEPAPEESARGTVAETTRPAYVAVGPNGVEVVLVQSRARIYV